jgi:hypothetical protein
MTKTNKLRKNLGVVVNIFVDISLIAYVIADIILGVLATDVMLRQQKELEAMGLQPILYLSILWTISMFLWFFVFRRFQLKYGKNRKM